MKKYHSLIRVFCFFILSGLTGCLKYQYATVHSNLNQTWKEEFVSENDSVKVVYDFNGEDLPIQLTVYNKLDRPMYINWKMSSLIIGGRSFNYLEDEATVDMSGTGYGITAGDSYSASTQALSGVITLPVQMSFIPPLSYIKPQPQILKSTPFKPTGSGKKTTMYTSPHGLAEKRVIYSYSPEDSPLQFRSYLTLSFEPDFKTNFTVADDFWIGEIFNSGHGPSAYKLKTDDRNVFYTSKATTFGTFMGVVGLAGIVILYTSSSD